MKKILIPTDFSKPAQNALKVAAAIAEKAKAKLILLHIVEVPYASSFNVDGEVSGAVPWENRLFTLKLIQNAKKKLADIVETIQANGINVSAEFRIGNAFQGIREIITSNKVDLIVMGTSGRTKLEEMLIGSNTEKVVRHADCPVLTVHDNSSKKKFKKIVFATSMRKEEIHFAAVVQAVQQLYDAKVHVVRINTPENFQPDATVKSVMENFVKKTGLQNYTLNIFNDYNEQEGILHFADSIDADLIAMATHGRTGLAQILAGSIAEKIANHSKRPVLTRVIRNNK